MSIDARIISSSGDAQGLSSRIGDLERQVRALSAGTLGSNSIVSGSIAPLAIGTGHIQLSAITAGLIDSNAIETRHLSANSVTATAIEADAINAGHLEANSVDASEIKADAVRATHVQAGSIESQHLVTNIAMADKILANLVTATNVTTTGLSAVSANMGLINAGKIVIGNINTAKTSIGTAIPTSTGNKDGIIGTDSSNNITFWIDPATGNVELKGAIKTGSTGLGNLDGKVYNSVNPLFTTNPGGGYALVADAITAREITAESITAAEILTRSLTADRIASLSITANEIQGNAVTASKISAIVAGGNLLSAATTSFEHDATGWSASSVAHNNAASSAVRSTAQAYLGTASLLVTTTSGTQHQGAWAAESSGPFRQGKAYTASAYVRATSAATFRIVIAGTPFDASDWVQGSVSVPAATWTRLTATWIPNAERAAARVYINQVTDLANTFYIDAVQIEEGDLPTAWRQYIAPATIEGSTITAGIFRTAATGDRLEVNTTDGVKVINGGIITTQLKAGAGGLDLTASTALSAPDTRKIRFLRESDSSLAGEIYGYSTTTLNDIYIQSRQNIVGGNGASNSSRVVLGALASGGTNGPQLSVSRSGTSDSISVVAGGTARTLIDSDGYSSFLSTRQTPDSWQRTNAGTAVGNGGTFMSNTFTTQGNRPVLIYAGASIRPNGAGMFAGMSVYVNGGEVASSVAYYDGYTHAWQSCFFMGGLAPQSTHTIQLRTNNSGQFDANDRWTLSVIQM